MRPQPQPGLQPRDEGTPPSSEAEAGLTTLLGGRSGVVDASVPAAGFAVGWVVGEGSLTWAVGVAVAAAIVVAVWRLARRRPPRAAVLGLTGVLVAALIAARTGRAADFFLIQLLTNAASALVWTVSIWVRRPLLGLVVAAVLRQGRTWRADPVLRHAYQVASWWWVGSYVLCATVFLTLWSANAVLALSIARIALSWPLVMVVLTASWATLRRQTARHGHPGIRHPRPA